MTFCYDDFPLHHIPQSITGSGIWENGELSEFLWAMEQPLPDEQQHHVPPLFVDIGANVGWFTVNMAARGYDVAAYEGVVESDGGVLQYLRGKLHCVPANTCAAVQGWRRTNV